MKTLCIFVNLSYFCQPSAGCSFLTSIDLRIREKRSSLQTGQRAVGVPLLTLTENELRRETLTVVSLTALHVSRQLSLQSPGNLLKLMFQVSLP